MSEPDMTQILKRVNEGDARAHERLLELVYEDLKRLCSKQLGKEPEGHTLQPTALVHEAYLRLVGQENDWKNRAHFFSIAARMVRRILVDHARAKKAQKRDALAQPEPTLFTTQSGELDLLDLDQALGRLAAEEPEIAKVVELRFFAELTHEEIAHVMSISERTIRRHWTYAKAWLYRELTSKPHRLS